MFFSRKSTFCLTLAMGASLLTMNAYAGSCDPKVNMCGNEISKDEKASPIPKFSEVSFPKTDAEKRALRASNSLTVDGKKYNLGYHTIMRSGDKVGAGTFGLILDKNGKPVINKDDGSQHISVDNDFSSLLPVGNKLFMVSHFETRPAAMYVTELKQDKNNGQLTAVSTKNIDFTAYGGLWVPCAGSVTPWGTHLGGEEYPSNARVYEEAKSMADIDDYTKPMVRYFGVDDKTADLKTFRANYMPYRYGYPTEVTVSIDGDATPAKHFSMGREAVELAKVMPDHKTVYISDDGTNVGLFMYVADNPGDLSAGSLYAAKWNQIHDANGGYANLNWVDLGHATDGEIQKSIESGVKFSDIFETSAPTKDDSCKSGFTSIHTTTGQECLKVKPGMATVASRVETRRYAAMMGATTEFRKEEGITLDPVHKQLYVAMSAVEKGMMDAEKHDKGGPNHVRLPKNKCGTVYRLDLGHDAKIGSEYVAGNMYGFLAGIPKKYDSKNKCDINGIANPDNITFIPGRDTLIIGEDTGSGHQNDAVWSYNLKDQALTRIETTPYGSETTGVYFYPDINGFSYLMSVAQHPYGESDEDQLKNPSDAMGYTGYIGPMPAMK
ncbi:MAG: DUF839 domain-containing protein [Methylocystaceae bacterium]|nr:DUF839 domain-containing protein [Methylocystaceae bacterium]